MFPLITASMPALILLLAPVSIPPGTVEIRPGVFVLQGAPTEATFAALKAAGITHVINLRRDGEAGFDMEGENEALTRHEIAYIRLAMGLAPARDDFDLFRTILRDLPRDAKVLVHCGNGNRAAGALCAWLVMDHHMNPEAAIALARQAGLARPDTEKALRAYLAQARS